MEVVIDYGKASSSVDIFQDSFRTDRQSSRNVCNSETSTFNIVQVSEANKYDMLNLHNLCSTSCAFASDGIPLTLIKRIATEIATPLEVLFNFMFFRADVPTK